MKNVETNLKSTVKAIVTLSQFVFIDGRLFDEASGITKEVARFIEDCSRRSKVIAVHYGVQQVEVTEESFSRYIDFGCTGVVVAPSEQYIKETVVDYILSVGVRQQNVAVVCKESEKAVEIADGGFHVISRSMLYSVYHEDNSSNNSSWHDTPGVIYTKSSGSTFMYLGKGTIESNSMRVYIELPGYVETSVDSGMIHKCMVAVFNLLWNHELKAENITSGLATKECESFYSDIFIHTVAPVFRSMLEPAIKWED